MTYLLISPAAKLKNPYKKVNKLIINKSSNIYTNIIYVYQLTALIPTH